MPELAEALASIPESVTSVKLGLDNRVQAKNAVVKLCDHIKSENGKDDIEKILKVLALDELKSLNSINSSDLKNLMTASRGFHHPLSDMMITSVRVSPGQTGNFPKKMMPDVLPSIFTPLLCGDEILGRILKNYHDEKMVAKNQLELGIASSINGFQPESKIGS